MSTINISPPRRHGVNPSQCWLPAGSWLTIFDFLVARFPHINAEIWQQRLTQGNVLDSKGNPIDSKAPYTPGAHIFYYREIVDEPIIPFQETILFENDYLIAIDKPPFLPVSPVGQYVHETLQARLQKRFSRALTPLHRLDRATRGVILFSKNPDVSKYYHRLFAEHAVHKVYEAIAPIKEDLVFPMTRQTRIVSSTPFFLMQEISGIPNTKTDIELIKSTSTWGVYRLTPHTGKQHQLRVHMACLGIPIQHDDFYPQLCKKPTNDYSEPLQLLAKSLAFIDPISQKPVFIESRQYLSF